jgi:hypothetical protein
MQDLGGQACIDVNGKNRNGKIIHETDNDQSASYLWPRGRPGRRLFFL